LVEEEGEGYGELESISVSDKGKMDMVERGWRETYVEPHVALGAQTVGEDFRGVGGHETGLEVVEKVIDWSVVSREVKFLI
jgi:hypothetical protein